MRRELAHVCSPHRDQEDTFFFKNTQVTFLKSFDISRVGGEGVWKAD